MNLDHEQVRANVQHVIDNMTAEQLADFHKSWLRSRSFFDLITALAIRCLPAIVGILSLYMIFTGIEGDWTLVAAAVVAVALDMWYVRDARKRFFRDLFVAINLAVIRDMEKEKAK